MAELIYSVRNIFNDTDSDGCLTQYGVAGYLIPAYQRGYKWASDEDGAVTILLKDLKNAYEAKKNEYYLQYITAKLQTNHGSQYLELLDGQQRLTTLSILIAVASRKFNFDDIADKISYQIREGYLKDYIHNKEELSVILANNPDTSSQDKYYLTSAAKKIDHFFDKELGTENNSFYDFVLDKVKIIVNVIDKSDSEKVFSNLNSKVELSDTELVKGLLLTKSCRNNISPRHFKEIEETRIRLGIQWDSIARWCNSPEIRTFYFGGREDGVWKLLEVSSRCLINKPVNEPKHKTDYPLFNLFNEMGDAKIAFDNIINVYNILRDLYKDIDMYNMLGFLMLAKGSSFRDIGDVIMKKDEQDSQILKQYIEGKVNKEKLKSWLLSLVLYSIPDEVKNLSYGDDDNDIHKVLLALNVFDPGKARISKTPFNFFVYKEQSWSLEHIFPQSPEGKKRILTNTQKQEIKEMLRDRIDNYDEVSSLLNKEKRDDSEKQIVKDALGRVLNTIGNMCLLTGGDNASNGCKSFNEKRTNILDLIKSGSFVPRHTFEVFSKVIFPDNPGTLDIWTRRNMDDHVEIIEKRIKAIREFKYEDR